MKTLAFDRDRPRMPNILAHAHVVFIRKEHDMSRCSDGSCSEHGLQTEAELLAEVDAFVAKICMNAAELVSLSPPVDGTMAVRPCRATKRLACE